MYITHVKPWKSKYWRAPEGELQSEKGDAWLGPGGDGIEKGRNVGGDTKADLYGSGGNQRREQVVHEEAREGVVQ